MPLQLMTSQALFQAFAPFASFPQSLWKTLCPQFPSVFPKAPLSAPSSPLTFASFPHVPLCQASPCSPGRLIPESHELGYLFYRP